MSISRVASDHIYDWSEGSIRQDIACLAQTSPSLAARSATIGCHFARLADRALQALRQARVQMRGGSRTWTQVLPVSELPRRAAADGLCAAGRSCGDARVGCQLPAGACCARRNLSDQSRAITAPRGAVRAVGERSARIAHRIDRYRRRRAAPGQHDRTVAGRGGAR